MKKVLPFAFLVVFALATISTSANNRSALNAGSVAVTNTKSESSALIDKDIDHSVDRSKEIQRSDRRNMVREGRHERRRETGHLRIERHHGGVIYISAGTVILILILIVIL